MLIGFIGIVVVLALINVICQGYMRDKRRYEIRHLPCRGSGECKSCSAWPDCAEL